MYVHMYTEAVEAATEATTTAQNTVEQVSKLSLDKERPEIDEDLSTQSRGDSEAAGVSWGPTLIDILYSLPSDGTPVDATASEDIARKKVESKEQYLYRRTSKVLL